MLFTKMYDYTQCNLMIIAMDNTCIKGVTNIYFM